MIPEVKKEPKEKENKIKISLKEMPKKHKDSGVTKEKVKETQIAPPMPKGKQLEKLIKKPPIRYEPKKEYVNKNKLPINPPKKEIKHEPIVRPKTEPLKKPFITLIEPKEEHNTTKEEPEKKSEPKKNDALYALLSQDKSSQQENIVDTQQDNGSSINQDIKELYGSMFGKLSAGQQEYILDNQEIMRRITQQVLTRVASVNLPNDLNVNRSNIIEFNLHPNGDMTDFRFIRKSGYYILDDTTKETLEYAYSRYPRPTEKTLIRYNVFYNLARY